MAMSSTWIWHWTKGHISEAGTCKACWRRQQELRRRRPTRTCTKCGITKPRSEYSEDKRIEGGLNFFCRDCMREANRNYNARRPRTEAYLMKTRVNNRRRKAAREITWDGVTDLEIYERDRWECQMPDCERPEGRSIPEGELHPSPWSRSVDHVTPLSLGGDDTAGNKRAAHLRCNIAAGNGRTNIRNTLRQSSRIVTKGQE